MSNFATKSVGEQKYDIAKKWADIHSPTGGRHWWVVIRDPQNRPRIVSAYRPQKQEQAR